MTTVEPPDRTSLPAETAELLDFVEAAMGHVPATIELLSNAPELVGPFLTWSAAIARKSGLTPRDHEILALRISHLCGSSFEWDEHAGFARDAGLTEAEIESVRTHPTEAPANEADRLLLDAVDEIHRSSHIAPGTLARLEERFDPSQLVAIPMIVGQYAMLCALASTFDIRAEPGAGNEHKSAG